MPYAIIVSIFALCPHSAISLYDRASTYISQHVRSIEGYRGRCSTIICNAGSHGLQSSVFDVTRSTFAKSLVTTPLLSSSVHSVSVSGPVLTMFTSHATCIA